MIGTLGHLPQRWWDRWQQKSEFSLETVLGKQTRIDVMHLSLGHWPRDCVPWDEDRNRQRASLVWMKWHVSTNFQYQCWLMSLLSASLLAPRLRQSGWRDGETGRRTDLYEGWQGSALPRSSLKYPMIATSYNLSN